MYDGCEYKNHNDFLSRPENLSLMLNTDGVCLFRSSTVSLWPLWLVINELPPGVRLVTLVIYLPFNESTYLYMHVHAWYHYVYIHLQVQQRQHAASWVMVC